MDDISARNELKPVTSGTTTMAKISGAISMISGSISVAVGAAQLITGRGRGMGGVVIGGLSLAFGKAVYDSAKGADRARNYAHLSEVLKEAETSKGLGR